MPSPWFYSYQTLWFLESSWCLQPRSYFNSPLTCMVQLATCCIHDYQIFISKLNISTSLLLVVKLYLLCLPQVYLSLPPNLVFPNISPSSLTNSIRPTEEEHVGTTLAPMLFLKPWANPVGFTFKELLALSIQSYIVEPMMLCLYWAYTDFFVKSLNNTAQDSIYIAVGVINNLEMF